MLMVAATVLAFSLATEGWYWFYAFELPARHTSHHDYGGVLFRDIVAVLPFCTALSIFWLSGVARNNVRRMAPMVVLLASFVGIAAISLFV